MNKNVIAISKTEYNALKSFSDAWIKSILWDIPFPEIQGPKPLWDGAKLAYIKVRGRQQTAMVLDDKAWVLDVYEPTGELYSNWTFVRFLRGMDI